MQGKELHPPLHLGVEAIEKGAFGSHLTKVANFTNSIEHYSFVGIQSNGPKYCYLSLTIQLNISYLFTHS